MKGYKGFDKDLRCRDFQYEVGKEYYHDSISLGLCRSGFHFCKKLKDVYSYYNLRESRICEVEALGNVVTGDDKCVTNHIKIIRELSHEEVLGLVNTGKDNTGLLNSGDWNSGNWNSGDRNRKNLMLRN